MLLLRETSHSEIYIVNLVSLQFICVIQMILRFLSQEFYMQLPLYILDKQVRPTPNVADCCS